VYLRGFVSAAGEHGYKAIPAPVDQPDNGNDLPQAGGPGLEELSRGLRRPDQGGHGGPRGVRVQSQRYEANTSGSQNCGCFEWFVGQAAAPARKVAAGLDVRAGLATNQGGYVSTGQALYTDTINSEGSVDGYLLNVPEQGAACPSCVPGGAPQVAVSYLEMLGYTPRTTGSRPSACTSRLPARPSRELC
jgi:hypothetical protein